MKTNFLSGGVGLLVLLFAASALGQSAPMGGPGPMHGAPMGASYGGPGGGLMMPMGMSGVAPADYSMYPPPGAMPPYSLVNAESVLGEEGPAIGGSYGKGGCGKSDCGKCCGKGGMCHHLVVYGEYMYLRARDAEVAFAVPIDGPITQGPPRVEVGPVAVADQDYQPGFRFGVGAILDECTMFTAEYAYLDSSSTLNVATSPPNVLLSMVEHPSVMSAASDFLEAHARYDIRFDLIDVAMHRLFYYGPTSQLGWSLGIRYVDHEEQFEADFAGTGTENVSTDIDFYGTGLRAGLEYENYIHCQWYVYGKAYASLIPGEFRASFQQSQSFDSRVVDTAWRAGRIVTIWDLELGMGWTSKCQNYRASLGYVFSAWTNMVQTDEWIEGVHTNNFIDMDATSTFDGLVGRFEARF